MDAVAAYDGKARDYAAFRLPYAPEGIDALAATIGLERGWTVADIGSGPGHLTGHFADRVDHIYAVEPNDDMRREAQRVLGTLRAVEHVSGRAERTGLPDASVDLVTVGQALHWFDPEPARREFARILRPGGWLALVWTRIAGEGDLDIEGYFEPRSIARRSHPMTATETWEQFIGGMRSCAGAPRTTDPEYPAFERLQRRSFDRRAVDGLLTVSFSTETVVGNLA